MTAIAAIVEILQFMRRAGGPKEGWYVGIASNPRRRVFGEHQVIETLTPWIWRDVESVHQARRVESYFLNAVRTDGGPGGGLADSRFVYAYRKNPVTKP
ncbi:MAG: hypothetical protein HY873_03265 [Chloroflexi bacterium]|nr:hypothetical protein [Chloroflexota bacterium]